MSRKDDADRRRRETQRRMQPRYGDLSAADLAGGDEDSLEGAQHATFLGTYSAEGLTRALEHYGLFEMVRTRGYQDFAIAIDTSDPFLHGVRIRDASGIPLVEMRARLRQGAGPSAPELAGLTFLEIEWLSAEDPHRTFSADRPALPGQRHPGLGIGPELEELMALMARRLGAAGVVATPQYVHNAAIYHPRFFFVDPAEEGRFAALLRDLASLSLPALSWAVTLGCVDDNMGRTLDWKPGLLVLSRSPEVDRYFDSARWIRACDEARAAISYSVDEALLAQRLAERGLADVR